MVILANRHRSSNEQTRTPLLSTERGTSSVSSRLATKLEAGSFLPAYMRGEMTPTIKRTHFLSLTLTHWTPLQAQGLLDGTVALDGSFTANISGSRSPLLTSAAASPTTRPPTAIGPEVWNDSVVESQHNTDRFPRFAYLLRNGTPKPESDEGRSPRSADPGGAQASVATIPDAPAQCGVGDETGMQSCAAASASGTLALSLAGHSSPSRASTPALASADTLASVSEHFPLVAVVTSQTTAMANYPASTSASWDGARNEQLLSPTRRGADHVAGERITADTQVSIPSADTDADPDEQDEHAQDAQSQGGAQTAEGQPKKKRTRRAGVAITRVRRMQREVRRLAEEEEGSPQQRQQPSLLLGAKLQQPVPLAVQPGLPSPLAAGASGYASGSSNAPSPTQALSPHRPFPNLPPLATSPPPRSLTSPVNLHAGHLARPQTRIEPTAPHAAHSRGPAYDRILEDGDDVVLLPRLPGPSPSPSIWAYRPEERERPRGGSA